MRGNSMRFGALKVRFFSARIGHGFYIAIANHPTILEDLWAMETAKKDTDKAAQRADSGPVAHAMARIRPENWNQVLSNYQLSWTENNRAACLANMSPMCGVGRALAASGLATPGDDGAAPKWGAEIHRRADQLYAVHFFCPDAGQYLPSPDGKTCTYTIHGSTPFSRP